LNWDDEDFEGRFYLNPGHPNIPKITVQKNCRKNKEMRLNRGLGAVEPP